MEQNSVEVRYLDVHTSNKIPRYPVDLGFEGMSRRKLNYCTVITITNNLEPLQIK